MEEFFNSIEPRGGTPLGACLEKVVRDVFKKEKGGVWNRWNPKGKKYNILVITDGEPGELPTLVNAKRSSLTRGEYCR